MPTLKITSSRLKGKTKDDNDVKSLKSGIQEIARDLRIRIIGFNFEDESATFSVSDKASAHQIAEELRKKKLAVDFVDQLERFSE